MDESLEVQIQVYVSRLNTLIGRGRELQELLAANPMDSFGITAMRVWQQDVGVLINELSGGSKAHWLARAFSQAFLVRADTGQAAEGVASEEIIGRLLGVLEQAVASLSGGNQQAVLSAQSQAPAPHLFEFVHNLELRPVLEQALAESRRALEAGHIQQAFATSCGILEAIVTDALEHKGLTALADIGVPPGAISDWSFQTRVAVAERAGLIRNGCARLPAQAWTYRDSGGDLAVSERDARIAGQVLRVVMRDLDPGR